MRLAILTIAGDENFPQKLFNKSWEKGLLFRERTLRVELGSHGRVPRHVTKDPVVTMCFI